MKDVFKFLKALTQNNSKEWMDSNRSWYEASKSTVVELFDPILDQLKTIDPRIVQPNARKSLNRINNNLLFHPDRPVYKDHFGIGFGYGKGLADFYIHVGLSEQIIAGGLWHPSSDKLKKLRMEIDYEGDRLANVIYSSPFKNHFELYQEDKLKSSPKGYSLEHEHIELLRMKSMAAIREIELSDFSSNHFPELVIESYQILLPMLDFINEAIAEEL